MGGVDMAEAQTRPAPLLPKFGKVSPTAPDVDEIAVPDGYYAATLIRWGEPIFADAPEFDVWTQTKEKQEKQFGYNCDYIGYFRCRRTPRTIRRAVCWSSITSTPTRN
jgi:secreted PhoX family phosphatase